MKMWKICLETFFPLPVECTLRWITVNHGELRWTTSKSKIKPIKCRIKGVLDYDNWVDSPNTALLNKGFEFLSYYKTSIVIKKRRKRRWALIIILPAARRSRSVNTQHLHFIHGWCVRIMLDKLLYELLNTRSILIINKIILLLINFTTSNDVVDVV
jgi:hypothetical protein